MYRYGDREQTRDKQESICKKSSPENFETNQSNEVKEDGYSIDDDPSKKFLIDSIPDKLEAYHKYYYNEAGFLTKRNETPKRAPKKVKFGNPKLGFQEKPLENYLFSGVNRAGLFKTELNGSKNSESKPNIPEFKEKFLDTLQQFHNHHSISTDRDYSFFDEQFKIQRITIVLLTSQNIERISKRLNLSQEQKFTFKLENSAKIVKPAILSSTDPRIMDQQYEDFRKEASLLLKQSKTLKHIYLLNGNPVFSLVDIPEDCTVLFCSHSPFFSKMVNESSKYFNINSCKEGNQECMPRQNYCQKLSESNKNDAITNLLNRTKMCKNSQLQDNEAKEIQSKINQRYLKQVPQEVIKTLKVLLKGKYHSRRNKVELINTTKQFLTHDRQPAMPHILNDTQRHIVNNSSFTAK